MRMERKEEKNWTKSVYADFNRLEKECGLLEKQLADPEERMSIDVAVSE